ncbi:MAG: ATP-binding protein [Candidatus Sericytochromatia bacterium]|nr:ATP-binding protein [Candidatus Sericytochromatia bacterium]
MRTIPPSATMGGMSRSKLPIGIQTFREIREEGAYYVDKTGLAVDLVGAGKTVFLSRPRRFGKSLFVDTLKELFEGNRDLFSGLAAEDRWDWSVRYPVIRIDFASMDIRTPEDLVAGVEDQLLPLESRVPGHVPRGQMGRRLRHLIQALRAHAGQRVVVLVDEYDKPILDQLERPELAREMREALRGLFGVLKGADADLKFVFLTGVSKFSKVSLFSGLNQLRDITLEPRWSALCGYTQHDLETVFAPELEGVDLEAVRLWYNGYNWGGTAVYNPFDVLLFLESRQFRPYWFETGTPTFLVDLLARRGFFTPDLVARRARAEILSAFDVENIEPEALLWQTGYLTIHDTREIATGSWLYTLGYPNREVEASLNLSLLPALGQTQGVASDLTVQLTESLLAGDSDALQAATRRLFASIPHDWMRNNPFARFEGYYASVFYSHLAALGLDLRVEDATNRGRIDLTLRVPGRVYVFEFKVVDGQPEGKAMAQIRAKGYGDKYKQSGTNVMLVAIEFSRVERNVVAFEVAAG